jgi:hypothetical protein
MDLLYEREIHKEIDEAERRASDGAMEEVIEEMEDMELDDDDGIALEDDEAVRAADA